MMKNEISEKDLEYTEWMLDVFDTDYPEPKCNICGRVIYSGAGSLCNQDPCGLKK